MSLGYSKSLLWVIPWNAKLGIRQAIVDGFELSEEPRLFIVTEKQVPGILILKIREATGVKAVVVY